MQRDRTEVFPYAALLGEHWTISYVLDMTFFRYSIYTLNTHDAICDRFKLLVGKSDWLIKITQFKKVRHTFRQRSVEWPDVMTEVKHGFTLRLGRLCQLWLLCVVEQWNGKWCWTGVALG